MATTPDGFPPGFLDSDQIHVADSSPAGHPPETLPADTAATDTTLLPRHRPDGPTAPPRGAVRYRQPIQFDEVLTVHVALAATSRATFQMAYLVTVGEEARATGVTVHGCTAGGRPTRLPEWLAAMEIGPAFT